MWFQTKAQTIDSLRDKLNNIYFNVDKSQIPTGYLKEYGDEFTPLHWYNGVLTDSNTNACVRSTESKTVTFLNQDTNADDLQKE